MGLTVDVCGVKHPHARGHIAALNSLEAVERIRIWDSDLVAAEQVTSQTQKAVAHSGLWEDLLADAASTVACVFLPSRENGPQALKALLAGKHVYSDKPGALDSSQMGEIVTAVEKTGKQFCCSYPWRVDPIALEIRSLICQGILGEIWSLEAKWLTSQVALRGPSSPLFSKGASGGGILTWLGCHWMDLLRFIQGAEVTAVSAMVATQCREGIDVEDVASVSLRFSNGAIGTLRAGYVLTPFTGYDPDDISFSFEGSLGSLSWHPQAMPGYRLRSSHPSLHRASHRTVEMEYKREGTGYFPEYLKAFLDSALSGSPPPSNALDALRVLQVLEAIYRSAEQKREVEI